MNILQVRKYYHLTGKKIIEQAKFAYSHLGKTFENQIKSIKDQGEKQIKTIEEHGKELVNVFTEKGKQSIPADKPKNIL